MSDALEQRAVLHLLSLLCRERSRIAERRRVGLTEADPDVERAGRLSSYKSAVEALRVLGAISSAEAMAWRRRFKSAAAQLETQRPEPDADTRERVEDFLGKLFSDGLTQDDRSPEERVRSFRRSVWALESVGAIRMDAAERWIDRVHVEHGVPTRKEEEQNERSRTCLALDLRRVIAAPMAVGGLRISHLELYADGALLYSLEPTRGSIACGTDPRSARPFSDRQESPLKVADDVGTTYEPRPYHGFAKALTPAIPNDASRLHVSYAGAAGEIALR